MASWTTPEDSGERSTPSPSPSRRHGVIAPQLNIPLPFDPPSSSSTSMPRSPSYGQSLASALDGTLLTSAPGAHPPIDFGPSYTAASTTSASASGSGSASRRPLPAQPTPPRPPLPASPYPSYQTPPPTFASAPVNGSLGRRQLPTPPVQPASSHLVDPSPPIPPPRPLSRALPSLPPPTARNRTISSSNFPEGDPPPPPPRPHHYASTPDLSRNAGFTSTTSAPPLPPSRTPSQSTSTGQSVSSSDSAQISRNTSLSTRASEYDTRPSSVALSSDDNDAWLPILERFGDLGTLDEGKASGFAENNDGIPTIITSEAANGRGTPTQRDWLAEFSTSGRLIGGGRDRATSTSTIVNNGIEVPSTPKGTNMRFQQDHTLGEPFEHRGQSSLAREAMSFPESDTNDIPPGQETWNSDETIPAEIRKGDSASGTPVEEAVGASGLRRQPSETSSLHPHSIASYNRRREAALSPSWQEQTQPPAHWVERKLQIHQSHNHRDSLDDDSGNGPSGYDDDEDWPEEEEEEEMDVNEIRFFQPAFLSEMALQLRDKVERRRHIKAGIAWVGSFTGKDIVTTIQSLLPAHTRDSATDRRFALILAQSLQNQLWFVEVDWDIKPLRDSSDDVFRFMGEMEGMGSGGDALNTELPKGLMTMATRCYSPSCSGDGRCYSPRCPHRTHPDTFLPQVMNPTPLPTPSSIRQADDWKEDVDPMVLRDLDSKQLSRQDIIRQALASEVSYEADLNAMERLFIEGLRNANPPVIPDTYKRETFIHEVFNNALELREACRRLIESFSIRMREQPIILSVGDLFLEAATEFRNMYPEYTGRLPQAEAALTKEMDENPEFRLFVERSFPQNDRRRDIKYLITRPSTQLQRYPAVLEGILNATDPDDPDREFLYQALQSIQNLSSLSQLKLFHASKGRGPAGKLQWFDLVPEEQRAGMEKKEQKRQMQIWELIQGEMEYVADLESIETLFVNGLRLSDPAVIDRNRLDVFLDEAFHNYRSLLDVHSNLLEKLQARQLEQHPNFGMISDLVFDAALNWQEAYMEYVTHYPIAKAKVQEEESRNSKFAAFLQRCLKDPTANRQDVYHFINRPIPRLLRYNLLLADILKSLKDAGPPDHPDIDQIPQVMEVIGDLGKATQKGVAVNEAKVELWTFQHSLDGSRFSPRMVKDLDLAHPMRELIHKGRVYRQPEGSIGGGWTELIVLLFDHYLVLAKSESRGGRSSRKETRQVRYVINRRPIPLELLSLGNFTDPPRQRTTGRIFGVGVGGGSSHDTGPDIDQGEGNSRTVYPFNISFIGQGQLGGSYTLWTDSASLREEWREKLMHAKVLRLEVNDAGKVFEMNPISVDTFYMAPNYAMPRDKEDVFTGRVTCSCPFVTTDNRRLIAIGCPEGVWIGVRTDPHSFRKVLHIKNVQNVAVLEDFNIFLVLSEKTLHAYHLEALVPSAGQKPIKTAPERVSQFKEEVQYFTVGKLDGRTLVVYMKRETTQSTFKIMEPVLGRGGLDDLAARQRRPFGFLGKTSEWFRPYKMFYLPAEVYGLHFLKHKMAIVCSKGFEIMDLTDLKGGSIPIFDAHKVRERPSLAEIQRKCEAARPLGMFRSTETEFLLCYDSFGIYVDRHGEPNRDCLAIEWEGRPDSIAFHPPYLLLISAPFIEIRHIDTAKLLQIYTGSDLRLTWDGSGGQRNPPGHNPGKNGYGEETRIQEPQIHICQRVQEDRKTARGVTGVGQHVFELTPTLLLNNPLMNPLNNTHDPNYVPPPPLTFHATPQIRQARPPSIMTTNSVEQLYKHNRNNNHNNYQSSQSYGQYQTQSPYQNQYQGGGGFGYGHRREPSLAGSIGNGYYPQQQQQNNWQQVGGGVSRSISNTSSPSITPSMSLSQSGSTNNNYNNGNNNSSNTNGQFTTSSPQGQGQGQGQGQQNRYDNGNGNGGYTPPIYPNGSGPGAYTGGWDTFENYRNLTQGR